MYMIGVPLFILLCARSIKENDEQLAFIYMSDSPRFELSDYGRYMYFTLSTREGVYPNQRIKLTTNKDYSKIWYELSDGTDGVDRITPFHKFCTKESEGLEQVAVALTSLKLGIEWESPLPINQYQLDNGYNNRLLNLGLPRMFIAFSDVYPIDGFIKKTRTDYLEIVDENFAVKDIQRQYVRRYPLIKTLLTGLINPFKVFNFSDIHRNPTRPPSWMRFENICQDCRYTPGALPFGSPADFSINRGLPGIVRPIKVPDVMDVNETVCIGIDYTEQPSRVRMIFSEDYYARATYGGYSNKLYQLIPQLWAKEYYWFDGKNQFCSINPLLDAGQTRGFSKDPSVSNKIRTVYGKVLIEVCPRYTLSIYSTSLTGVEFKAERISYLDVNSTKTKKEEAKITCVKNNCTCPVVKCNNTQTKTILPCTQRPFYNFKSSFLKDEGMPSDSTTKTTVPAKEEARHVNRMLISKITWAGICVLLLIFLCVAHHKQAIRRFQLRHYVIFACAIVACYIVGNVIIEFVFIFVDV